MSRLVLKGKRIYLENLIDRVEPKTIQHYLDNIDQSKYMYKVSYPYTMEDAKQYFNYLDSVQNGDTTYELGIFDNEEDTFIGVIALENINFECQNSEIGYWIVKDFWKKGYASEACKLIIEYAFKELGLNRLYANLQKENTASLALLTSLGFQVEGLLRKHVMNKGEFVDRYICGLLRDDWQ